MSSTPPEVIERSVQPVIGLPEVSSTVTRTAELEIPAGIVKVILSQLKTRPTPSQDIRVAAALRGISTIGYEVEHPETPVVPLKVVIWPASPFVHMQLGIEGSLWIVYILVPTLVPANPAQAALVSKSWQ